MMSATPTESYGTTSTFLMLRNDLTVLSSPSRARTTSARPWPKPASASAAVLVAGSEYWPTSTTASVPRRRCSDSTQRSARRRALRLTLLRNTRGLGPNATPPPIRCGVESAPARARPVPFWRNALAPVIFTSPRVLVEDVPWRRAFSSAVTASCTSAMWNSSPNTSSSRSALPDLPRYGALGIGTDLHGPTLRARHGAAQQEQVLVGDHVHHGETLLGHALVAHLARAADALEDAGRSRGGTDRARGAHVVRAVGDRSAAEVVPLHRSLEALALRGAGDLDGLALLESLDGHRVANLQLAGLVAELLDVAERRGVGLLEVAQLRLRQPLLAGAAEAELHGLVAVALMRADAGDVTRAGLDHGHTLHAAVLLEDLRHPDLLPEERRHRYTSWIWMSTPAGR